ncbi:isoprenylcysteine carboxylmethyltransferase family protein [Pandoraea sp.]|uniref:methyltransferase family protein n=1 Tax=Pandoraea sp. TaxID=1883445 RepID=UPI00121C0E56|nr:isoprenylcysteine carboxylmethyltransferase family protein [Pandoraea sp.]TAL57062.1 MAG: isoprenylcysteine carboxylmethyltransferase family protein [Pandoraea sp.]TAM18104.1 MAG: isoprenylcysteine carboxylmethyltransferase family protein [Pandoraea sp.]
MLENEAAPVAIPPAPVEAPHSSAPPSPGAREFLTELACRSASATLLGIFAYGAIRQWLAAPARITLVLLVVTACVTVGLSLFSKVPAKRDWTPMAFVCSVGGTYYFLAVQLAPGVHLVPEWAGATLQVLGLAWQLFAKASLRRAFGILPANRGVVSSGPYRFMRHPMYLGYFMTDIGFLLVNFDVRNCIVYGAQFALQAGRIWREERLLSDDEQYRAYRQQVRYRVLPGLF